MIKGLREEGIASLFYQLLALTLIFFLVELSFFMQGLNVYVDDFHFISSKLQVPYTIIPGVVFFVFSQVLVHAFALFYIFLSTLALAAVLRLAVRSRETLSIWLWSVSILTILLSNQYFFPNSKFSFFTRFLLPDQLALLVLVFLYVFWCLVTAVLLQFLFRRLSFISRTVVLLLGFFLFGFWFYQQYYYRSLDAATEQRPNIIIIGIDSLRPDFLEYFGSALKTPFLTDFLKQSTVFANNFTPLARTFPSWMGILSGVYPKESGIRFNLAEQRPNEKIPLLSTLLQREGYKTIYASDETRFSNFDRRHGFDQVLTPPIGLNDFLLGSLNDFPLSNLFVNSVLGAWLFPYSYGNRPAFVTYDPNSFLSLLKPHLSRPRHQPLFLAVHFCLPHYPYLWASQADLGESSVSRYQHSIIRVDQQVRDFVALLQRYQILDKAVVVLLSDHGEALELSGDRITSAKSYLANSPVAAQKIPRFYPPSADKESVNQSAGHGTDVLGFAQYHSLLAFKLYGLGPQAVKKINAVTLLLDIKPTLLQFLKLPDKNSGISLASVIQGKTAALPSRSRNVFLESDFSPEAIRSAHPETRNLIFEGIELFRIDPETAHIFVKESMGKMILSSKQYALIKQDWVLALYPSARGRMRPVLLQLSSGQWTMDLNLPFARKSPEKQMIVTLKQFYGSELKQRSIR